MNPAGSVAIQSSRLSQSGINRQVLKDGASVLVRVISDRGGGKYEGSVAGVRVQLNSTKTLKPGESFSATISVKNGTIVVTPKNLSGTVSIPLTFNEVSQTQLFSLLESLGLPADNLSSSILKSFKQMGLKLDSVLANKIRTIALRFAGKEKSAAEILSILAQKGLEADGEEIKELLALLEGEAGTLYENKQSKTEKQATDKKSKEKLINKINLAEGLWYLLPFELVQFEAFGSDSSAESQILGNGCIRLLYDNSKALKLLNLDCNYNNQKYLFSLLYETKKIKKTFFNVGLMAKNDVQTVIPDVEIAALKKHFMAAGINPGQILWAEKDEIEGNASELESFVSFGGEF